MELPLKLRNGSTIPSQVLSVYFETFLHKISPIKWEEDQADHCLMGGVTLEILLVHGNQEG